jgi:16S rRNA processing protein RimM
LKRDARILMGVIGRPHGVRGFVHVVSHTADPVALAAYSPLLDEKGREVLLTWRGPGIAAVTIDGHAVTERNAAEQLTNLRLFVPRDRLPNPDEDEYYLADLVGLAAEGAAGPVGRVTAVHDYGAGASLEIARDDGGAILVPFTRQAVPVVDLAAGRVVIEVPREVTRGAP